MAQWAISNRNTVSSFVLGMITGFEKLERPMFSATVCPGLNANVLHLFIISITKCPQ